ncbi:MAG: PAS domain-containing protein [Spirochaetia bacterium]
MGRTEEQLAGILQQMPYPVEVLDREGTVVMINKAFQELYGIANLQTVVGCFNIFKEKTLALHWLDG